jgi:hypothetical protein
MNEAQGRNAQTANPPSKPGADGHAGEAEMSNVMAHRPDLVHPERAPQESGADLNRLDLPQGVYTGIWWYASFPNHYQGDASGANAPRGAAMMKARADGIAAAIRSRWTKQDRDYRKNFSRHPSIRSTQNNSHSTVDEPLLYRFADPGVVFAFVLGLAGEGG